MVMMGLLEQNQRPKWRKSSSDYSNVLPSKTTGHTSPSPDPYKRYPKRYRRVLTTALMTCVALGLLYCVALRVENDDVMSMGMDGDLAEDGSRLPPLYERWHATELAMPQHNPDLPFPEGKEGRYFWFPNHVHDSGWGNAMQELILNAHLAYVSQRAYVFDNYTWSTDLSSDYSDFNGKLIPSRIPLTALVDGPIVGAPFPNGEVHPRAVRTEYFREVCPEPTVIHGREVTDQLSPDAPASQILQGWVDKLNSIEDRCVEVDVSSSQIFEIWIFGSKRVLDIWPSLRDSPILTQFHWSPLIHSAIEANAHLFTKTSFLSSVLSSVPIISPLFSTNFNPTALSDYTPIPGLLALHIRKGDFVDHCHHLANWSSVYNGFNTFPELPDKFERPSDGGWGVTTAENDAMYIQHCFPSIPQIVDRVTQVRNDEAKRTRRSGGGLSNIFVMTNGKEEWLEQLKAALMERSREERRLWDKVTSSRDVSLDWEQKYVAQAVDMVIGQRAQVLIGNGFSSLTSNIVMLRMANDIPPETNRFW